MIGVHALQFCLRSFLAASWLVNAPAAVMIHYSMALLILVIAWQEAIGTHFAEQWDGR